MKANGVIREYLNDAAFLKLLDNLQEKTISVRLTVLTWDELPLEEIQGKATGGSISVSGSGDYRRSGNISLLVDDSNRNVTDIDNIIAVNKKCKVEIGIHNTTAYYTNHDIIWFPQGIFIISSVNITHDMSGITMSVSLSDKMCLLNGEISGQIGAPADLAHYDIEYATDNGEFLTTEGSVPVRDIIMEVVHHIGGEQTEKIFINDIPETGKWAVRLNEPDTETPIPDIYRCPALDTGLYDYSWESAKSEWDNKSIWGEVERFGEKYNHTYNFLGFTQTDFTYPGGDLTVSATDTVTSVLSKINQQLGSNYEYFYDIEGNFIFREIRNYLNKTKVSYDLDYLKEDKNYYIDIGAGDSVYQFNNSNLVQSYSNALQYATIKNDYTIWGTKDKSWPIRYHLAIDKKPQCTTHDKIWFLQDRYDKQRNYPHSVIPIMDTTGIGKEGYYYQDQNGNILVYGDNSTGKKRFLSLYQGEVNAEPSSGIKNPYVFWWHNEAKTYYQYVNYKWAPAPKVPIWAEIDEENPEIEVAKTKKTQNNSQVKFYSIKAKDYRTELLLQGLEQELLFSTPNIYYAELKNEWPLIYDILHSQWNTTCQNPTSLQWYLEIIDNDARIGKYSIQNIGRRAYAENGNGVNCIFEPAPVWDVIIIRGNNDATEPYNNEAKALLQECQEVGQSYLIIPNNFYIHMTYDKYQDAMNILRSALYVYTGYSEAVQMSTIPIYHLEPNTRITIRDKKSGIYGDYIINSFEIPLDVSSTMNFNCTKCLQKI